MHIVDTIVGEFKIALKLFVAISVPVVLYVPIYFENEIPDEIRWAALPQGDRSSASVHRGRAQNLACDNAQPGEQSVRSVVSRKQAADYRGEKPARSLKRQDTTGWWPLNTPREVSVVIWEYG